MKPLKTIQVAAAVIKDDNKILATQRGYGEFKGGWEFPGGKIEPGETPEAALIREIKEELTATITIDEYLGTVEYDYPNFHLSMRTYRCKIAAGQITLLEHEAFKWLSLEQIESVAWLPADKDIIAWLKEKW